MNITQRELARRFKVSQVTISRALRGDKGVNEKLRKEIAAEASRNGYSIEASNFEARQMRLRACGQEEMTKVVCAMMHLREDPGETSFSRRILNGLWAEAEKLGVEVVIAGPFQGDLPLIVSRRQVDGVIRLLGDIAVIQKRTATPLPWVSILYDVAGADLATVDNAAGAREVGRYVCAQGHRKIAFAGPESDLCRERLAGLREAVAEAGAQLAPEHVYVRRYVASKQPTRDLVDEVFGRFEPGSAPFTVLAMYNDYMAAVAMDRLKEIGWKVPQDVSLTGFDGALPADLGDRRIATAAIPLEELGAEALRLLYWRLQQPDAPRRRMVLEATLVTGETVVPPRTSP